jgi:hypothetical protein
MIKVNNQAIVLAIICSIAVALSYAYADESQPQSRLTRVTSAALDRVKGAADRGTQVVKSSADKITVKIEKLAEPEPHQPGQSNIVSSALRGSFRLAGNLTVEAGRFASDVLTSAAKLVSNTASATKGTVKQTFYRIANPRSRSKPVTPPGNENGRSQEVVIDGSGGQAPDELRFVPASS